MADGTIAVDEPSTVDKLLDTTSLTVGGNTVERERIILAGATDVALASVLNAAPTTEYGLVTRNIPSGTQPISAATLPLPAGAATAAKQPALGTAGSSSTDVLSVQGIASGTALPISAASLPLPSGASTAAKQPALGTAGAASTDVITIQGIASMTKLLVTPDSVALPANQSVNAAQLAGTATAVNSGTASAGTLRVVIATDQPQLTNKLLVTPDANSAINVAQINGVTPLMGAGNTGTGSPRVTLSTDQAAISTWGFGVTAGTAPTSAGLGGLIGLTALPTAVTTGQMVGQMGDKFGRAVSLLGTVRDLRASQTTTLSATTSETTIVTAAGSGVFADLVMLIVSNTSASTTTRIDFRDSTGGTILFSLVVSGGQATGFAVPGSPLAQTTANNNWTAQCGTSTTDVRVTAIYEKNK